MKWSYCKPAAKRWHLPERLPDLLTILTKYYFPRAYIEHEKLPSLAMPDLRQAVKEKYKVFDTGSVGELDVRAILEQSGNRKIADSLASNWQGGRYIAFRS